jgi:hypothetical protein
LLTVTSPQREFSRIIQMGSQHDSYNYFMSFLIAESQLNIYEFNRWSPDLNGTF